MFDAEHMIREMVRQESCCPDLLYHYCSKDGANYLFSYGSDILARSILKSKNDAQEYRAGIDLFCNYICERNVVSAEIAYAIRDCAFENIERGKSDKSCVIPFAFCLTDVFNSTYHWSEFVGASGGFCVVFQRDKLEDACRSVRKSRIASLELQRCYYIGYDDTAINSIFEAICEDRNDDFIALRRSRGVDVCAVLRVVKQACCFAMCIKRAKYFPEREWRITMVAANANEADGDGYLSTGIREFCFRKDVLSIMRGVMSSPTGSQAQLQEHLFQLLNTRIGKL